VQRILILMSAFSFSASVYLSGLFKIFQFPDLQSLVDKGFSHCYQNNSGVNRRLDKIL
jgi:hypothetical protein